MLGLLNFIYIYDGLLFLFEKIIFIIVLIVLLIKLFLVLIFFISIIFVLIDIINKFFNFLVIVLLEGIWLFKICFMKLLFFDV